METGEQLRCLKDNGCEQMQGYYFSRPLPADEVTGLLQSGCRPGGNQLVKTASGATVSS